MKINKTLSLDYMVVKELQLKSNQSRYANDAIRQRLNGMDGVEESIPTKTLMAALMARKDCDPFVVKCLMSVLTSTPKAYQSQQI